MIQSKKNQLLIAGSIVCLILILFAIFFILQTKKSPESTLAEMQEVNSTQESNTGVLREVDSETQKKLDQIEELYTSNVDTSETQIKNTLLRYNAELSEEQLQEALSTIESENLDSQELSEKLSSLLGITILQNDIRNIQTQKKKLQDETRLRIARLEDLSQKSSQELQSQIQDLVSLALEKSLSESSLLTTQQQTNILTFIISQSFETHHLLETSEFPSLQDQKDFLETQIQASLTKYTSLSTSQK